MPAKRGRLQQDLSWHYPIESWQSTFAVWVDVAIVPFHLRSGCFLGSHEQGRKKAANEEAKRAARIRDRKRRSVMHTSASVFRAALNGTSLRGQWQPAVSCEFLWFSAVSCENPLRESCGPIY